MRLRNVDDNACSGRIQAANNDRKKDRPNCLILQASDLWQSTNEELLRKTRHEDRQVKQPCFPVTIEFFDRNLPRRQ